MKFFEKIKIRNEREIRIFGIPIFQYGKKEINKCVDSYFKIFPKSFEHKALDKILKFIPKENKHDFVWLVRTTGLGEAQLLNYMFKELNEKFNIKKPCIISHRGAYKGLFELYTDIPFYEAKLLHDEYAIYLKNKITKYKGKKFFIHHCTIEESLAWLKEHQEGSDEHVIHAITKWGGIDDFSQEYPVFSEELKERTLDKVKNLINLDNFVFFAPEANGTEKLPTQFWSNLTNEFKKKGFDVFVNTKDGLTKFGRSTVLDIAEAAYLSSLAKKIVVLRCGFSEILAAIKEREEIIVLYPKFRGIKAESFLKIYNLLGYPFVNKNIKEYTIKANEIDKVSKKILEGA